nr:hypothetical protein [Streptomyces sp. FBKL.4005]
MPQEQQTRGRHAARRKKDKGGLARSPLLMAVGTVVSRATGLIRQVLQAAALGTCQSYQVMYQATLLV